MPDKSPRERHTPLSYITVLEYRRGDKLKVFPNLIGHHLFIVGEIFPKAAAFRINDRAIQHSPGIIIRNLSYNIVN